MKHAFKLSLLCSAILMSGCGDNAESSGTSDEVKFNDSIQQLLNRSTSVKFTLQGSEVSVPLPTYLLMDTTDGSLAVPTAGNDALSNPAAAMNTADGWPTSMPISLTFEGNGFTDGPVISGVSVIKLTKRLTDIGANENPIAKILTINNGQNANPDFSVVAKGNTLNILFTTALDESSEYIFAISKAVKDKNGEEIGTSGSYASAKQTDTVYESGSLASVQKATQGIENVFEAAKAATGVAKEDIIYSSWFSTQSIGDTLAAVKGATGLGMAGGANNLNALYKIDPTATPDLDLSAAYTLTLGDAVDYDAALNANAAFTKYINGDAAAKTALNAAYQQGVGQGKPEVSVTPGVVKLPHYLEKGATWNTQPMSSAMPSLVKVNAALSNPDEQQHVITQLSQLGIDPTKLATDLKEQVKLVGAKLTLSDGSALDSERLITRYAPVPTVKSVEDVNVLVFTPKGQNPTDVVIYQHGITSAKENAFAFAQNLAQAGIAVVAFDLPLHGERSLDDQRSANANILSYINMVYLPVARDNVRQSELDFMGVRAALAVSLQAGLFTGKPLAGIDLTKISALGHSLGGIITTSGVAAANKAVPGLTAQETASLAGLYNFKSLATHNTGGQIANLLLNSPSYGNMIKHNIAYSGSVKYKAAVDQLVAAGQCDLALDKVAACFQTVFTQMTDAQQADLESAFNQFGYATQTVLDTIDPFTNAADIDASLPVFMTQIQNDQTVPNSATGTFAGTEPLAAKIGLATINNLNANPDAGNNFFNYKGRTVNNEGAVTATVATHSTFIGPTLPNLEDASYHGDMQARNIEFFLNGKLVAPVSQLLMEE